ncbi:hypothetical protein V6N12_046897 [Hibiscus sabdariffa]|uniref:Uncharacterized protein n=1 Tax=Hibiscus sabdariffa TaxID=183260 RepID=A0ABR2BC05_9ROSI
MVTLGVHFSGSRSFIICKVTVGGDHCSKEIKKKSHLLPLFELDSTLTLSITIKRALQIAFAAPASSECICNSFESYVKDEFRV